MSYFGKKVNHYIKAIKAGDDEAFTALYRLTVPYLKNVAKCHLKRKADVDDVVQETFCRVYRYIKTSKPEKDGYNWLYRITQRVAYDFNQKNKTLSLEDFTYSLPDEKAYHATEDWIDKCDLCNAAKTLETKNKLILHLYYYEDLTYEQIAEKLNMGKTTVQNRLKKSQAEIGENLINNK